MSFLLSSLMFNNFVQADVQKFDELIRGQKVAEAKNHLGEAIKKAPKDVGLLERRSRLLLILGDQNTNKDEQLRLYDEALKQAEKVIEIDSKAMMGYVRRAAANGKVALFKGVLQAKDLVNQTKADTEMAIKLNNASPYSLALAHYILGRAHLKLSETPKALRMPLGLTWGNLNDAEKNLAKAVELFGESISFRVDYAKVLVEKKHNTGAKEQLNKAIALPQSDPGDPMKLKEAKELLSKIS